jgi:hypothetical protein
VLRNKNPARMANARVAIDVAPENGGLRKNRSSSSGSSRCSSTATKAPRLIAATANRLTIWADVQPRAGPSMMAQVSVPSVSMSRSCPGGSARRGWGARVSGA